MTSKQPQPKLIDYLGAAVMGAALGAMLAWGLLNGGL
jgi:hypothetical protein